MSEAVTVNDLEAWWLPFTPNRHFKRQPRLLLRAEGIYYWDRHGRRLIDGQSGLWCCNAGHNVPRIVEAIRQAAGELDYAPGFQWGHPRGFELANRLIEMAGAPFTHVFFTNSGSESVETALKIALAWHRLRGEGERIRLIGRERGYHGVNFGGMSVGGIAPNRLFGPGLPAVDHLRLPQGIPDNRFARGLPPHGGREFADDLERLVALHGGHTIAAVIIEPVPGSGGVYPPPVGYLERIREICDAHGILLIFDEVITGFGRLGAPFAKDWFKVTPDIITLAKGLTNGAVPMGAVLLREGIYETFMQGPEHVIELFHGYTYSAHPLAAAAGLATLETYEREDLFARAARLAPVFEEAVHALNDAPNVIDIRNLGLMAAVELAPRDGAPGLRGLEVMLAAHERGAMVRVTGDTLALAPPLVIEEAELMRLVAILGEAIRAVP